MKLFGGWPCNSPNLNTIKNYWLQKKHMHRKEKATSTDQLKKIARNVGRGVTLECLDNLYQSRPRQMQAVTLAKGGHIKY